MNEEIIKLFQLRDEAVFKQNYNLFLSTQVGEIENGGSAGYLNVGKLETEVLKIVDDNDLEKVVFVKETYSPSEIKSYSSFLVYFLINTIKGWKIYKIK